MKVVILGPSRKITFKYQRTATLKPPQEKKIKKIAYTCSDKNHYSGSKRILVYT